MLRSLGRCRRPQRAGLHLCSKLRAQSFSSAKARILVSDINDIVFHFAVEEYLIQNATISAPLMYLWRPAPVVTIGRHQNPWKECVLSRMEDENVKLVRRRSGGGAVFMDLGGSVFTFLAPSDMFSIDRNFDVILGALRRLGVDADRKGRNDLTVGDRKMSGSAFKHAPDRGVSLHHGTILVDSDMLALQRYLTPDKRKLQAKGISSVGARVMNLREQVPSLSHDDVCEAFIAEFQHQNAAEDVVAEHIDESSDLTKDSAFQKYRLELENHEWRFGRTPEFSHQLDTRIDGIGIFDVHMQVIGGKVQEAVIFSDTLYPDVIDTAVAALKGADYGLAGVGAAMDVVRNDYPEGPPAQVAEALAGWLVGSLMD